ncbi:MAG TPA: hypothetical protein VI408_03605 [Gaiellaceae bacterium]
MSALANAVVGSAAGKADGEMHCCFLPSVDETVPGLHPPSTRAADGELDAASATATRTPSRTAAGIGRHYFGLGRPRKARLGRTL